MNRSIEASSSQLSFLHIAWNLQQFPDTKNDDHVTKYKTRQNNELDKTQVTYVTAPWTEQLS
jgi:hypothetical protein